MARGGIDARDRARHAGPGRPRPRHRPVRGGDAGRRRRGAARSCATSTTSAPTRAVVLADLAEFVHFVTRLKIVPDGGAAKSSVDRSRARRAARRLPRRCPMRVLSRAWQMLLKGIEEVQASPKPARRRRDGAGPPRLCRRPADARRGAPRAAQTAARASASPARRRARPARGARLRPRGRAGPARGVARGMPPRAAAGPIRVQSAPRRSRSLAASRAGAQDRALRGSGGAREREARHPDEDRAGARRAAGALRGRPARVRARAEAPRRSAGRRSVGKLSANGPAGAGWWRCPREAGAADAAARRPRPQGASRMTGVRADPLVRAVLERFPGAEIVDVRATGCRRRSRRRGRRRGRARRR